MKMLLETQVWPRLASLSCRLSTLAAQWRFASWGQKSRLEHSSKLVFPNLVRVGEHVHICSHAWFNAKDDRGDGEPTLHIGDRSYLGRFVQINAWREVRIEQDVLIGDRVFISDADHLFRNTGLPIRFHFRAHEARGGK